jgi:hypothetical protein
MTTTYTANLRLAKPADGDTGWGATLRANADALDALAPLGGLAVAATESPSASLNIQVGGGSFRSAAGSIITYAGSASQVLTASATNSIYLTDAGVLTVSTSGWPTAPHVRLAVVVTGTTTLTTTTDVRIPFATLPTGGAWVAVRTVTATDTATLADGLVRCDATGGAFTETLPTPVGCTGKRITVKRVSASNNVTVATAAGSIDGAATKTLGAQYAAITVISNNVTWSIESTYGTVT